MRTKRHQTLSLGKSEVFPRSKSVVMNGVKQGKVKQRQGKVQALSWLIFCSSTHSERDVSDGSAVVIDLVGVMASFYALV